MKLPKCEGWNRAGYRCQYPAIEGTTRCKYHPIGDERSDQNKERAELNRGKKRAVREALREMAEQECEAITAAYIEARYATTEKGDPDHRTRLIAVEGLLAQVYGKPMQPTEERGAVSFTLVRPAKLSREQMLDDDVVGDNLPLQ